jgi:phosphate-selective porin OprO/OprP
VTRATGMDLRLAAGLCAFAMLWPATVRGQEPAAEPTKVDLSGGGLTVSSGVNSLTIGARMQYRWTVDWREEADADAIGSGAGSPDGPFSQFDVPRMRVTLAGGAFRPWLRYQFQFDFSRTPGEGDSKIKDAMIEIRPTGRPYRLALGQFKAPFGFQQLVSSGRQQFVDRAITDAKYAPAREMGALFGGTVAGRTVGYEIGAFNGSGESVRQTKQTPFVAGRVFWNPLGVFALSEGSSDAPDSPVLHVGLAARGGSPIRNRTPAGIVEDADTQTAYDVEFGYRSLRWSSTAEYFVMMDEQENPAGGGDLQSRGFHAQLGYMLVPRTTEVALRVASVDGDVDVDDAAVTEVRGVFGYYWRAHNLKLQADAGQLRFGRAFSALTPRARSGLPSLGTRLVGGEDLEDFQLRVQMQLAF